MSLIQSGWSSNFQNLLVILSNYVFFSGYAIQQLSWRKFYRICRFWQNFGKIVYPLAGVRVLSFAVTAINLEDTCCSVFCVFVCVCKRTQNTELCRRWNAVCLDWSLWRHIIKPPTTDPPAIFPLNDGPLTHGLSFHWPITDCLSNGR